MPSGAVQPRQFAGPDRMRHALGHEAVRGEIVAEQHDQVGLQRVGRVDRPADVRQPHVGPAGMQVGDHRDGELAALAASRRRERVTRDHEALRLDGRRHRPPSPPAAEHAQAAGARAESGAASRARLRPADAAYCVLFGDVTAFMAGVIARELVNGVFTAPAHSLMTIGGGASRLTRQAARASTQSSVLSSARVKPVEQFVDFGRADDERRGQRQHVAHHRAHDQAFLLGEAHRARRRRRAADRTNACCALSATSSTPPIRPRPRASPTSGCSPSAASRAWNCGAFAAAFSTMRSRA